MEAEVMENSTGANDSDQIMVPAEPSKVVEQKQVKQQELKVPTGYVPVQELYNERRKAKEAVQKASELETKLTSIEQRESKRVLFKEQLSKLGDNWKVEDHTALEELVDALSYD